MQKNVNAATTPADEAPYVTVQATGYGLHIDVTVTGTPRSGDRTGHDYVADLLTLATSGVEGALPTSDALAAEAADCCCRQARELEDEVR